MHGIIASLLTGSFVVGLNWQNKVKSLSEKEFISFPCFEYEQKVIPLLVSELDGVDKFNDNVDINKVYSQLNSDMLDMLKM